MEEKRMGYEWGGSENTGPSEALKYVQRRPFCMNFIRWGKSERKNKNFVWSQLGELLCTAHSLTSREHPLASTSSCSSLRRRLLESLQTVQLVQPIK